MNKDIVKIKNAENEQIKKMKTKKKKKQNTHMKKKNTHMKKQKKHQMNNDQTLKNIR